MTEERFTIEDFGEIHDNGVMLDIAETLDLLNSLSEKNEQLKQCFRELITSGYWEDDYLTEQDWNDVKMHIERVFEKVMNDD